jgi:metallo-beta-lactamase family protein
MFQGTKTVKALNYEPLPFDVKRIRAVVLTHAHIDHCGLVPKLVNNGFNGPIYSTAATADLLSYVLPDSGYIQELEVDRLNRRNRQRGQAAVTPIYTRAEAERSLRRLRGVELNAWVPLIEGVRMRLWDAAHILGSASVELEAEGQRLLFSGDIGPGEKPFQGDPQAPADVDYVFVESTYGDRIRPRVTHAARRSQLKKEVLAALRRKGVLLIPAFAVERTQELLADLGSLMAEDGLPETSIFVDSPLASRATEVFTRHLATGSLHGRMVRFISDVEESRALSRLRGGAIILAGSGMCDAGRIRHHLKTHLPRPNATVLLVGYQAPGTLGRLLLEGKEMVRIQGEEVAVAAQIRQLDQYSGHADQDRLAAWIAARTPIRHQVFLIHGEDAARNALEARLLAGGMRNGVVRKPVMGETVRLTGKGARTVSVAARVASPEALQADWHNAYAEAALALRQALDAAPTEEARRRLIAGVRRAISRKV